MLQKIPKIPSSEKHIIPQACITNKYRVVQKTAQSLWHHNFSTAHHTDMRFSATCSERNSLHD